MNSFLIRRALPLLAILALAGCGGTGASSTESVAKDAPAGKAFTSRVADDSRPAVGSAGAHPVVDQVQEPALIQKGEVSLTSKDVARARSRAETVATRYGGQVTDSHTSSDDHGRTSYASLTIRVPAKDFEHAMHDLEGLGTLQSSTSSAEDVTTQAIDIDARVKSQRASIERIRTLLSAAKSIGDVVRIESELSSREAALDSLVQQQRFLGDQTARSTITVEIDRHAAVVRHEHAKGFLAGLHRGWSGLVASAGGVLLVLGILLPWLPLVALATGLGWWLVRRWRRRAQPFQTASAPA